MEDIRIYTSIAGQMVIGDYKKGGYLENPMALVLRPGEDGKMGVAVLPLNPLARGNGIRGCVDDLQLNDNLLQCHNFQNMILEDVTAMYTKHITGIDIVPANKVPPAPKSGLKLV